MRATLVVGVAEGGLQRLGVEIDYIGRIVLGPITARRRQRRRRGQGFGRTVAIAPVIGIGSDPQDQLVRRRQLREARQRLVHEQGRRDRPGQAVFAVFVIGHDGGVIDHAGQGADVVIAQAHLQGDGQFAPLGVQPLAQLFQPRRQSFDLLRRHLFEVDLQTGEPVRLNEADQPVHDVLRIARRQHPVDPAGVEMAFRGVADDRHDLDPVRPRRRDQGLCGGVARRVPVLGQDVAAVVTQLDPGRIDMGQIARVSREGIQRPILPRREPSAGDGCAIGRCNLARRTLSVGDVVQQRPLGPMGAPCDHRSGRRHDRKPRQAGQNHQTGHESRQHDPRHDRRRHGGHPHPPRPTPRRVQKHRRPVAMRFRSVRRHLSPTPSRPIPRHFAAYPSRTAGYGRSRAEDGA